MVLANTRPLAAIQALSFEISEGEYLQKGGGVTAWTIDDIKRRRRQLPFAVYMLPPLAKRGSSIYETATRAFRGLEADVLTTEKKMADWARAQAAGLEGERGI